jgi:hypothetical protein
LRLPAKNSRGQALAELALAAPLFGLMFFIAWHGFGLLKARMELSDLARGLVIGRQRAYEPAFFDLNGDDAKCKDTELLKRLGRACMTIDVKKVRVESRAAKLLDLGADLGGMPSGGPTDNNSQGFLGYMFGQVMKGIAGECFTLKYTYQFKGPLAHCLPKGIELQETLCSKCGTWKAAIGF